MKPLSERHTGLLIRMSYHRACVCSKRVIEPLLRRQFATTNTCGNYELTPEGKKAAQAALKEHTGRHLRTWGGLSIGTEVMIVQDDRRKELN